MKMYVFSNENQIIKEELQSYLESERAHMKSLVKRKIDMIIYGPEV